MEIVYVGSCDGNVYALDAHTGAMLWSYAIGRLYSSPAVADGVLYVGSANDNVYALNAHSGAMLWSYTTGAQVFSSPAVANGVVYVGSDDGSVYAFSLKYGSQQTDGASKRPDLKTLRPDFNLKVSQEGTTTAGAER